MRDLHVIVSNKIATYLRRDGSIICGPNNYQIVFSFDSEWDAYETKMARFKWNGKSQEVEFTGSTVKVPTLANTTLLEVGVYVEDLSTTTSAQIPCLLSCLCGDEVDSGIVLKAGSASNNGTFKASEDGADGFSEFTVDVEGGESGMSGKPVEVATQEEIDALAVGTIFLYTGESGTYENGALYIVEEGE